VNAAFATRPGACAALTLAVPLLLGGCRKVDPRTLVAVADVETYWAVDRSVGGTQYLSPVVRFRLVNNSQDPLRVIDASATFRRKEEAAAWSGGFAQVAPVPDGTDPRRRNPLGPGQGVQVLLKPEGEGRYTSTVEPEQMIAHPQFRDVWAEVYVRVGSSAWTKMTNVDIERRLGPRGAAAGLGAP
jgi:hypothetical protein